MRPGELSRALVAAPSIPVGDECLARLRDEVVVGVGGTARSPADSSLVTISLQTLRRLETHPEVSPAEHEPFSWKPVFVRRSLGLAIVEACASGRFNTPAEATGPMAAEALDRWGRTGWRHYYWEPWLAGLAAGARSVVLADATTWATDLWCALDWKTLGDPIRIGGADDQWMLPGPIPVRLRGRSEVRVAIPAPSGSRVHRSGRLGTALVSVSSGVPSGAVAERLSFLALTAGLSSPSRPVPARVLGIWPEAGMHRMVEIDEQALRGAVDLVVRAYASIAGAERSAEPRDAGRETEPVPA